MNDKVHKFVPQHHFRVKVGDEETDVITLEEEEKMFY
jgi:hypothetical protein